MRALVHLKLLLLQLGLHKMSLQLNIPLFTLYSQAYLGKYLSFLQLKNGQMGKKTTATKQKTLLVIIPALVLFFLLCALVQDRQGN